MIINTILALLSAREYKPDMHDYLCLFGIIACTIICAIAECM